MRPRIRQILYATDLTPTSEPAWEEAQLLGAVLGAEVVLAHVVPPMIFPAEGYFSPKVYQELVDSVHREARQGVDALLARVTDPRVKAKGRVEEGGAAQRILEVAREESADLIVMGTHGRRGVPRAILGSVADRVVRQAACPVLVVRSGPEGTMVTRPAISRICYATDFSPIARAAWPWALAVAEATGAQLELLHVTPLPVPDQHLGSDMVGRMARLLEEQGRADAERFLHQWEQSDPAPFPRDRIEILVGRGVVGDEIVHWATARSADLVVIGTHGWSGLLRWMLGSAAHHVVQAAPCPVLIVGSGGAEETRRAG